MAVTLAQIDAAGTTFESFFAQLSGSQLRNWMNANGATVSEPPSHLLADGALSYWEWNEGDGAYNGSNKYFATGMDDTRAYAWRAAAEAAWNADAAAFVNTCVPDHDTAVTLISASQTQDTTAALTRMVLWNVPDFTTALGTYPDLDARENIIQPVDVYWGLGTSDPETIDVDTVANALAALPEGRRYIRLTDYTESSGSGMRHRFAQTSNRGGLLRIYEASNGRMCLYDQEFDHPYRMGLTQENWRAAITAYDSNYRAFWRELRAKGESLYGTGQGWKLLDGCFSDFESRFPFYWQQRGISLSSALDTRTIASVDTSAETITLSSAVDWETGDPVAFTTTNTLPSPLSTSVLYFLRKSSTTVFSVHTTAAAAIAGTGAVNLASSGTGTHTVNHRQETLQNIIANDPNWEWYRTEVLLPALSSATWLAGADLAGSPWTFSTDHRAFMFDAAQRGYFTGNLKTAMELIRTDFDRSDLVIHEYDSSVLCPGTHTHGLSAHRNSHPFGIGNAAGDGTLAMYGDGDSRWYWPTESYQAFSTLGTDPKKWATFVEMCIIWRSIKAASNGNIYPWLSHLGIAGSTYNLWGTDGLWEEFILHVLLGCNEFNFYVGSSDSDKSAGYNAIRNLVDEVDEVCQYRAGKMLSVDPITTLQTPYIAHRAWRGNRWVWRVTPNPNFAAPTISESSDGIQFVFADGTSLNIPGGQQIDYTSLGTLGYWIEQGDASSITRPSRLFDYGSRTIQQTATRVVQISARPYTRYLTIKSHPDNTGRVYLGTSSAVSTDKTQATCGFVLEPGDEREYPIAKNVDGQDETGIYAIAESGSQYLQWETR